MLHFYEIKAIETWKVAKLPAKVFNSLVRQGRIWVFS